MWSLVDYITAHPYLHLQGLSQPPQGEFGGGVRRISKQAKLSSLRGHKHDPSHPPLLHGGDDGPRRIHTAQIIHFHQALEDTHSQPSHTQETGIKREETSSQ